MCRGREESEKRHFDLNKPIALHEAEDAEPTRGTICCQLCGSKASLYCRADDAFLCRKCDEWVHGANFLAHRHVRCMLCNRCQNLTRRYLVGTSHEMLLATFRPVAERCGSNDDESRSLS